MIYHTRKVRVYASLSLCPVPWLKLKAHRANGLLRPIGSRTSHAADNISLPLSLTAIPDTIMPPTVVPVKKGDHAVIGPVAVPSYYPRTLPKPVQPASTSYRAQYTAMQTPNTQQTGCFLLIYRWI